MTRVVGPVRGGAIPEDVLQVQPGSMLRQQSYGVAMTSQRRLMQRRRMRMRSLRIEAIRVLPQVEQQLDDRNVTELGRPCEGEMPVFRRGAREGRARVLEATGCCGDSQINSGPSRNQHIDRLGFPMPQCCA